MHDQKLRYLIVRNYSFSLALTNLFILIDSDMRDWHVTELWGKCTDINLRPDAEYGWSCNKGGMSEVVGRDGTGKHAVSPSCNYYHQYSADSSKILVLSLFPSELNLLRKQETCLLLLLRRRWISPLLHHHYLLMNLMPLVSSYSACLTVQFRRNPTLYLHRVMLLFYVL